MDEAGAARERRFPSSREDAQRELAKVLGSKSVQHAPALKRFLNYVGEQTLAGNASTLNEFDIAIQALGRRAETFDPRVDTIVRIQARRLRDKLEAYFKAEGRHDRVWIEMPLGQYGLVFREREQPDSATSIEGLEAGLAAALEFSRQECAVNNLPYHTPSLMLALLAAPEKFFLRCLERFEAGLSDSIRKSLCRYFEEILPVCGVGFTPFLWADHEVIRIAISRAAAAGLPRANEKHCLEALLESPAKTVHEFKAKLGDRLAAFQQIVREMPANDTPDHPQTPGLVFPQGE